MGSQFPFEGFLHQALAHTHDEGIDFLRLDAFDIKPVDDVIDLVLFHLWQLHSDFLLSYQILKFPQKRLQGRLAQCQLYGIGPE